MGEGALWSRVARVPGLHAIRVTERLSSGTPDVLALVRASGTVAWIELKTIAPGAGSLGLRPDQAAFAQRWTLAGGLAVVLVQRGASLGLLLPGSGVDWLRRAVSPSAADDLDDLARLDDLPETLDRLARGRVRR